MSKLRLALVSSICAGVIVIPTVAGVTHALIKDYVIPTINYSEYQNADNYLDMDEIAGGDNLIISKMDAEYTKKFYNDWYNTLTVKPYNENEIYSDNGVSKVYCQSEGQALNLFANNFGHFWNYYLHQKQIPPTRTWTRDYFDRILPTIPRENKVEIRGTDYTYVDDALSRAEAPLNLIVYHGLEFMETEFYDQLAPFISVKDGDYDYKNCVGKQITSYGWLATSTLSSIAKNWSKGYNWVQEFKGFNTDQPPLKEPAFFKIKIPHGSKGVASLEGWPLMKWTPQNFEYPNFFAIDQNWEGQTLIHRNSTFTIDSVQEVYVDGTGWANMFEITLNSSSTNSN